MNSFFSVLRFIWILVISTYAYSLTLAHCLFPRTLQWHFFKITSGIPSYFGSRHITENQLFVFLVCWALMISSNWVSNYQKIFFTQLYFWFELNKSSIMRPAIHPTMQKLYYISLFTTWKTDIKEWKTKYWIDLQMRFIHVNLHLFFLLGIKKKTRKKRLPIDKSIKPLKTYIQVTLQERFKTHKGKEKKACKSSP